MENAGKKKKSSLGLVIGIGISILAIGLLLYLIDLEETLKAIGQADFKFVLLAAVF